MDALIDDGPDVALATATEPSPEELLMTEARKPMLLVCNKHEDTMSFVDLTSFEQMDKIPTGPNPHEIVLTPDGRFAYLSNYAPPGNTISVMDLVTRKHIQQISTGEYGRIHGAAIASDGAQAYFTAGQSGYVMEVSTAANSVERAIPTHGTISHMVLVSPDDSRLYTANITSENVSVIDRESGRTAFPRPRAARASRGMGFTPNGRHLWALNQEGGTITVIDVESSVALVTFPCPGMPVRIVFADEGRLALVPSWTENGELIFVDVPSRTERGRIPVGSKAIGDRAFAG